LKFHPPNKDNIYAWKSHYRQTVFVLSIKREKEKKVNSKRKSNQMRNLFVEPVTDVPPGNPLKFPKWYI